jgi:hypothetical protein
MDEALYVKVPWNFDRLKNHAQVSSTAFSYGGITRRIQFNARLGFRKKAAVNFANRGPRRAA